MSFPNHAKPILLVRHAALQRLGVSPFRSRCPACDRGKLFVSRDQSTFRLTRQDVCLRCGQRFFYVDEEIGGEVLPPILEHAVHTEEKVVFQPDEVHTESLTPEQVDVFRAGQCPECKTGTPIEGPHGGLSVNYTCNRCGQLFCDLGPFGVERIFGWKDGSSSLQ
jgi:uncharacterized protein (DUF983 family)